jgi:nucleoside-diphosphate-sugar epimerase
MNRATVIGADGFIGQRLLAHLRQLGWDCRAPARDDCNFIRAGDLGTVFYCAGLTADFARRPHDMVHAHVSLLNDVLALSDFDALVYLSSTRLYDGRPGFAGAEVDEDTPLTLDPAQPRHLYDLSKALGESLCRQVSGGRARIARLACVYTGTDDDADGFLDTLLARLRAPDRGPMLNVDSPAEAERDYVHIDDVLDALVAIASRGTRPLYNVAGGINVANRQLFARLGDLAGCELRALRDGPTSFPAPISIERMRNEFGWQPRALLDQLPEFLSEAVPC